MAEVPLDELAREAVDACRHRRVRGEDGAGAGQFECLVKGEPGGQVLPDPLQAEEARVPLVGVEDLGLRVAGDRAEGAHRAHAADAHQQLLAEPVLGAAAVEPVGHLVQRRLVLLNVGVEQQQRDPADLGLPYLRGELLALGQRHRHLHGFSLTRAGPILALFRASAAGGYGGSLPRVTQQGERQSVGVVGRVALGLPAVRRQRLGEVAVPVEQPDADDRDAEVAGALEVVAGQDAEAAGVLGQHGGDAVLRREVGDRLRQLRSRLARRGRLVPPRLAGIAPQVLDRRAEAAQEGLVGGQLGQLSRAQRAEHRHRIAPGQGPPGRVNRLEELYGRRVPGPAQVQHQVMQRRQRLGQRYADGKTSDRSHVEPSYGPSVTTGVPYSCKPCKHRARRRPAVSLTTARAGSIART